MASTIRSGWKFPKLKATSKVRFGTRGRCRCADPYAFTWKDLVVQPGLLAIWHTYEDKRWDPVGSPERSIQIEGSDGLTLNLTADARYRLTDTWSLEASFGSPLITREVRPDGLTRSMLLNAGLRFAF